MELVQCPHQQLPDGVLGLLPVAVRQDEKVGGGVLACQGEGPGVVEQRVALEGAEVLETVDQPLAQWGCIADPVEAVAPGVGHQCLDRLGRGHRALAVHQDALRPAVGAEQHGDPPPQ